MFRRIAVAAIMQGQRKREWGSRHVLPVENWTRSVLVSKWKHVTFVTRREFAYANEHCFVWANSRHYKNSDFALRKQKENLTWRVGTTASVQWERKENLTFCYRESHFGESDFLTFLRRTWIFLTPLNKDLYYFILFSSSLSTSQTIRETLK